MNCLPKEVKIPFYPTSWIKKKKKKESKKNRHSYRLGSRHSETMSVQSKKNSSSISLDRQKETARVTIDRLIFSCISTRRNKEEPCNSSGQKERRKWKVVWIRRDSFLSREKQLDPDCGKSYVTSVYTRD